jgi:hypothetical protein
LADTGGPTDYKSAECYVSTCNLIRAAFWQMK